VSRKRRANRGERLSLRGPVARQIETTSTADTEVRIGQDGERVLVLKNGVLILDLPWQVAQQIGAALYAKGKAAEQFARREEVAEDAALLQRAGAPPAIVGGFVGRPSLILSPRSNGHG
jgi:hypothetical protein